MMMAPQGMRACAGVFMRNYLLAVASILFLLGLSATPAMAQAPDSPTAACGPEKTQFKVENGPPGGAPTPPAAGKAVVYIVGFFNLDLPKQAPTIRIGTQGVWIGATKHNSFLKIEVSPGEQHYCAEWQARSKYLHDQISLYNFEAEPGKAYYLRATMHFEDGNAYIDFDQVSDDEGRFLVSRSVQAISHERK